MLPVEFRSFNECVGLSVADENTTIETFEALRMVAMFTGKLYYYTQGQLSHGR